MTLGIEEVKSEPTAAFYRDMQGIQEEFEGLAANTDETGEEPEEASLMTPSTEEEQQMILIPGYAADETCTGRGRNLMSENFFTGFARGFDQGIRRREARGA